MDNQQKMFQELKEKSIFDLARSCAYEYSGGISEMDVFPSEENLEKFQEFDEVVLLG